MKLAGVSIVRDEADIIESFVRRNLEYLDTLYIIVHRSIDGTREIVMALRDEGLPVRAFDDPGEGFNQAERINGLARQAFADGADFVFPIDGDEFIKTSTGRAGLELALAALPENKGGIFPSETYVPRTGDATVESCPTRRIQDRYDIGPVWSEPPNQVNALSCKVVVGSWFAKAQKAWIFDGNHVVFVDGKLSVVPMIGTRYAHFPCRTLEQLAMKCVLGWISCLASATDHETSGFGFHWKQIYQRVAAGLPLGDPEMKSFLRGYAPEAVSDDLVRDPLPFGDYVIRHAGLRRPRKLVAALLETTERLARKSAPRRAT